jgi:hypothetical protein
MHRRVAKKYLSRILSDHLQSAVSESRLNLSKLETLTERAKNLIEESPYKEEVYKEGGDMIFLYEASLESLRENLSILTYLVEKISLTGAADDLKPAIRKELDKAFKSASIDVEELEGFPTYRDHKGPSDDEDKPARTTEVPGPSETDWSDLSPSYTRPEMDEDVVP